MIVVILNHFAGKIGQIGLDNRRRSLLGTRIVDSSGYSSIYVGSEYKYTNTYGGRIREHIYLIQEKIGRQLEKNEVVHHIDGNKLNNDIYKLGMVYYDYENKLYVLNLNL